jgi:hypothetical protein
MFACSEGSKESLADGGAGGVAASGGAQTSGGAKSSGGANGSGGSNASGGKIGGGGKTGGGGSNRSMGGRASSAGGAKGSTGGAASEDPGGADAGTWCNTYCKCMAKNCSDKAFPMGCLMTCATDSAKWDRECRQGMCGLVPAQPDNDHCTHAFGVGQCLDER